MSQAQLEQRQRNMAKIAADRRAATHCKEDHEFTEENTYWTTDGRRCCRTCRREKDREARAFHLGQMLIDPNHRYHGSRHGYGCGCHCERCSAAASACNLAYRNHRARAKAQS